MAKDSVLQASVIASTLVDEQRLDYALRVCRHRLTQQGKASDSSIPDELLAEILVEQEVVTKYQADQLLTGKTRFSLGPYIITDYIGQGGMGQVFKGEHRVMGREVAVKVLPRSKATEEARDSFAREIRMQAKLDCPFLVRAFDAGQDGSVHYLVTEYVPGMDLRALIKSQGALPVQQAARIVMQAAMGLDYAHQQGLVHRDVKPGNILVTPEGEAKVSDVGLAGFAKDLIDDPRAGKIVGTPDYLSPEQIRTPLDIDPASDIYSLGCTLYYSVCGKVPYPGGDTESKLRRHLEDYPLHPRNFAPDITEDFVDIIVDMMEKDRKKRISSAAEVAARLEPWAVESLVVPGAMTKSPWLAPPPPSHEMRIPPIDDEGSGGSNQFYGSESVNHDTARSGTGGETLAVPPPIPPSIDSSIISMPAAVVPTLVDSQGPSVGQPILEVQQTAFAGPTQGNTQTNEQSVGSFRRSDEYRSRRKQMSRSMLIAMTIAIVVPPALLLGAILGYLASR